MDYFEQLLPAAEQCCRSKKSLSEMLDLMAKHPSLTPDNLLLLSQQMPEATALGGYNAWLNEFNRKVKPDATPIVLLKPTVCKVHDYKVEEDEDGVVADENGEVKSNEYTTEGVEYLPVHLYDINQTVPSEKSPDIDRPYLLTPVDIIAGCRDALKCDVEYTEDKTSRLVQYDVVAKKLIIATKEESVIAKECVNLFCLKAAEARTGRNDKLYLRLVAECAAEVVCRVNQITTGEDIKCLELWNKDKNPEQCLEMLNQVSLASRNVLSQLRQATNHPVLLDFDETCLLNQVLDQPNATIVRHRLSRLAKHTSIPILVEAIRSLQSKLMYFEASSQVGKVYKDRLDHRIMTLPVYRI